SVEDLVMGAIPGLPKVHLHNPVLAYEVGDDFMKYWHQAAEGKLDPFVHAMEGNPTGAMGLADYLGWNWRSKAGLPIVNVPGCPVQPDNMMETLLYLLYQVAGLAPMIPLDAQLRPKWLFGQTVHEGCDRGGYYEQGDFAKSYSS